MRKRRRQRTLLPLVIAFFMGVLTTVLVLVPAKTGPTLLVSGNTQLQRDQFGQTGQKIEKLGDRLLAGIYRAKETIASNLESHK